MSMINLMPPAAKNATLYARRNLRLLRFTIASMVIIIAMFATVILGSFYIDNAKSNLTTNIDTSKSVITTQKLEEVKSEAEEISQGVKLISQVLSKEVRFSKLLQEIGSIMPKGAVLAGIQLSNKVNGTMDLTANAIDHQSATQVQVNLEDPKNNLFEKVDTISVSCTDPESLEITSKYICHIQMRALFKQGAAVTFLASPPAGVQQ